MFHRKHIAFTHKYVCTNIRTHTCEQIVPERNPRSQDTPLRPRTLRARVPYIVLHTVHGDVAYDGDSAGGDVNTYTYSYVHVYVYVYIYGFIILHTYMHTSVPTYILHMCMHDSPRKLLAPRTTYASWIWRGCWRWRWCVPHLTTCDLSHRVTEEISQRKSRTP